MNTSNKFAVLQVQQPQQPRPKGDKLVTSISGPVPNVPKTVSKEQDNDFKQSNSGVSDRNNNNNRVRGGGERGRGGSRGGNRGGRGGNRGGLDRTAQDKLRDPNAPPKRNKRIYDKNSNVPKNDSKKGGQGTGNWGNEKEDPQRGADDAKKEVVEGEQSSEVKAEQAVEQEPEEKTITLKEYQEQQAALAPKIDAPKRREAGEGEKSDLHKYTVLKKDDEEEEKLLIKPKQAKAKKQQKKQTIALSDLGVNVAPADDKRGPRKYNNNNNYNKRPKKVNLPIEDTDSFPALK